MLEQLFWRRVRDKRSARAFQPSSLYGVYHSIEQILSQYRSTYSEANTNVADYYNVSGVPKWKQEVNQSGDNILDRADEDARYDVDPKDQSQISATEIILHTQLVRQLQPEADAIGDARVSISEERQDLKNALNKPQTEVAEDIRGELNSMLISQRSQLEARLKEKKTESRLHAEHLRRLRRTRENEPIRKRFYDKKAGHQATLVVIGLFEIPMNIQAAQDIGLHNLSAIIIAVALSVCLSVSADFIGMGWKTSKKLQLIIGGVTALFLFSLILALRLHSGEAIGLILYAVGKVIFSVGTVFSIMHYNNKELWETKAALRQSNRSISEIKSMIEAIEKGVDQTVRHLTQAHKSNVRARRRKLKQVSVKLGQVANNLVTYVSEFWRETCTRYRAEYRAMREDISEDSGAFWHQPPPGFTELKGYARPKTGNEEE